MPMNTTQMRTSRPGSLDRPGCFELRVQGVLAESWSDYLGGAAIEEENLADVSVSVIRGEFQDQAALLGMLNTLYDLGFPLLSLSCRDCPDLAAGAA